MRWYGKAGLAFVFGTGILLTAGALFGACGARPLGMGLSVVASGVLAAFSTLPWLGGFLRWRAFRAAIGARRGVRRAVAAAYAVVLPLAADPVVVRRVGLVAVGLFVILVIGAETLSAGTAAGAGPWVTAVDQLCAAFKGNIGKGLAMIAVIIAGLMFAFGEGGSKSAIAGLIFGAGMVLGAPQFLTWIGLTADC